MTEKELIDRQQEYGDKHFVVTRSGKFFSAYNCGAFALARATGYRVMRRPRKGGHFVLTVGFPESRLESVMEHIAACGGTVERQETDYFIFSNIDGSTDETLVSEQKMPDKHGVRNDMARNEDTCLRKQIIMFDLYRSTPMDAMNFIDTLQKQITMPQKYPYEKEDSSTA